MMRSILAVTVASLNAEAGGGEVAELPIFDSSKPVHGWEVYMAKFVCGAGGYRVHLYNRKYQLLGHLASIDDWKEIALHSGRTDSWSGYTGGSDEVKGLAVWLDLSEKARSEFCIATHGAGLGAALSVLLQKGARRG